jgi:GTP-binding protein
MVNIRDGLNPLDTEISRTLRKETNKPIFLVMNQADSSQQEKGLAEFLKLGMENDFLISAEQGRGLGELLDAIYDALPPPVEGEEAEKTCPVAIVGRPNVGKSSLLNALLGEERAIVSDEPGTTRDAVDTPFRYRSRNYLLIDTAGIRRSSKVFRSYERYSLIRAIKALERAEVALILLDATSGISVQDRKIAALADEKGCSSLLLVNKWDLMRPGPQGEKEFALEIREELKYLDYAPFLFISALTGKNVGRILPEVERLVQEREKVVPTPLLNRILQEAIETHQLPTFRGQRIKVFYGTQFGVTPPTFILFTNNPEGIITSYRRYLSHRFREAFGFVGTPIRLIFRKR